MKDRGNFAIPHHMNNLPKTLQEFIVKSRMGGENPKIEDNAT